MAETDVRPAYKGDNATFQVLRAFGSGPLLNLGYYPLPPPLALLNFLVLPSALTPRLRLPAAQQNLVDRSIALLRLEPGVRVLDVGCGRGASSFAMASACPQA